MRKHLSEFGLTVFSSYKNLITVEEIETVSDNAKYHIYMILDIPKISIDEDTNIICNENGLTLNLIKEEKGKKEVIKLKDYKPSFGIHNYELYEADIIYPYNNLKLKPNAKEIDYIYNVMSSSSMNENEINEKEFKDGLKEGIDIPVDSIYFDYLNHTQKGIDMEVLYIGQAFEKKEKD